LGTHGFRAGQNLALSDWSDYSGNYGKPGIIASTTSARGSTQFSQMEDALSDFLETKMIVLNSAENMKVVTWRVRIRRFSNWLIGWID
jgi:hypothetical protein